MAKSRFSFNVLRPSRIISGIRGSKYSRDILKWNSENLKREVYMEIFKPTQTDQDYQFPLLILNDGQDAEALELKFTLEQLAQRNEIMPPLVIAVHAGDRMQEYGVATEQDFDGRGSKAQSYAMFITQEVVPFLQDQVSIDANKVAIAGFSLGALSAMDIAWNHAEIFKMIGAFSGSFWWRQVASSDKIFDEKIHRIMHNQVREAETKPYLKFWFQTGTKDESSDRNGNGVIDSIDDTLDLIAELTKKGYRPFHDIVYYEVKGGEHNQHTWAQALPHFLKWAFPKN